MGESTPGPWVWEDEDRNLCGPGSEVVLTDGSAYGEYTVILHADSPNGRLVAAAPDLLIAGEQIVSMINALWLPWPGENRETSVVYAVVERMRAAIAKAKGASDESH